MNMKMLQPLLLVLTIALAGSAHARPDLQLDDVGHVYLENTGADAAQQSFHHGLAQLHNFEYSSAAEDFREAQRLDPNFALAYWGEAMTHNHPIWMQQDREAGLAILNRFADSPEARQEKAGSALERDLLAAIDVLYGDGEKHARDDRYALFMSTLHDKYPGSVDVASFYALSLMGTAHEGRDFATYMKAAATMQDYIVDYPRHPGVAHYLIHATDDPVHAPLGLRAAQAYADIAPNAAHAQHMTTHIFLALGDWDGVIKANQRASALVNEERATRDLGPSGCGHYPSWLMYGYLQHAKLADAKDIMLLCSENAADESSARRLGYYAWQRALYLFDTGDWDGDVAGLRVDFGDAHAAAFENAIVDGFVALGQGDVVDARAQLAMARDKLIAMQQAWDESGVPQDQPSRREPDVELLQLEASITLAAGDTDAGIRMLQSAVALEMDLPFGFGPPSPAKPSLELLGERLIEAGRYAEAVEALQQNLKRTPNKLASVAALAIAEERLAAERKAEVKPEAGASVAAR